MLNRPMVRLVLVLVLLCPGPVAAQTVTGTLQGTVKDGSGGVMPGTLVLARNLETGQSREATANAAGYYVIPFLPIGA